MHKTFLGILLGLVTKLAVALPMTVTVYNNSSGDIQASVRDNGNVAYAPGLPGRDFHIGSMQHYRVKVSRQHAGYPTPKAALIFDKWRRNIGVSINTDEVFVTGCYLAQNCYSFHDAESISVIIGD